MDPRVKPGDVGLGDRISTDHASSQCCSVKGLAEISLSRRSTGSVDCCLDATSDSEEVTVRAVLANDHQTYGRTRRLYRHSNGATVEEIDDRRIAQQ